MKLHWALLGIFLLHIYVLEWTNANGGAGDGWRPRVRRLAVDGRVTILAEVKENLKIEKR